MNVAHKYTGKELDNATGLYWYEWRSYDPILARFTTPDTLVPNPRDPQDLNRYSYVGNNPLRYTDPTGHLKINKFFNRAFGDVGTTLVGIGVGMLGCPVCGAAIMTQSQSGRYTLAGGIIVGTGVATFACGGCGAWATGAFVGSLAGGAIGGYSASQNGGDISSGVLFGSAVGAAAGAAGGQLHGLAGPHTAVKGFAAGAKYFGLHAAGGAAIGAGSGSTVGYAGGAGNLDSIGTGALRGVATGAALGIAVGAAPMAWDRLPDLLGNAIPGDIKAAIASAINIYDPSVDPLTGKTAAQKLFESLQQGVEKIVSNVGSGLAPIGGALEVGALGVGSGIDVKDGLLWREIARRCNTPEGCKGEISGQF